MIYYTKVRPGNTAITNLKTARVGETVNGLGGNKTPIYCNLDGYTATLRVFIAT